MWQMSAQSKIFTDRLYALFNTGFEEKYGKKNVALAFSQGNPDENMFTSYFEQMKNLFEFLGFNMKDLIVSGGNPNQGQVKNRNDVMERANALGTNLIKEMKS